MRKFLAPILFLISANIVFAGDISQFVFTTNSQAIKPNVVSEEITVQAQDAAGVSVKVPQTACLVLETNSSTGGFSSNSANWESVGKLTMNKNTANRTFYYKDSTTGNYILTIKAALTSCSNWLAEQWTANQNVIVSENNEQAINTTTSTTTLEQVEQSAPPGGASWPVEPQVFANAGEDRIVIVGADTTFSGKALGLQKEPLEGARYLWNFGDGSSKEGQNVLHAYKYPADYIVTLDVSSGPYSASDRALIKAIPNQIKITEANANFIKLKNGSNILIDIGGWFLKNAGKTFKFPAKTLIAGGAELPFASDVTGLSGEGIIEMLYPNGSLALSFSPTSHVGGEVQPTTVVDYKIQPTIQQKQSEKQEKTEMTEKQPTLTENIANNQSANIITVAQNGSWSVGKWLAIILGLGILAGGGFFFINRQGPTDEIGIEELP